VFINIYFGVNGVQILLKVRIAQGVSILELAILVLMLHLQALVREMDREIHRFQVIHVRRSSQVAISVKVDLILTGGDGPDSDIKLPPLVK
jgi:hypothetical protein